MNTQHLPRKPQLPATGRALSGKLSALLAACSVFALTPAQAQLIEYEDFETYTDGQVLANNGTTSVDGWVKSSNAGNLTFDATVVEDAGNNYLLQNKGGAAGGFATVTQAGSGFGATTANDGFQTIAFRFLIDSSEGTAGAAGFGLAANDGFNDPHSKVGFEVNGSGEVLDTSNTVQATIQLDTWYDAWLAVDHQGTATNGIGELYLQSASDANFSTQTLVGTTFGGATGAGAYDTILLSSTALNGLNFAIDDIVYDNNGKNLAAIPEPSSAVLISGLVAGAMLLRRRRR